MDFKRQIAYLFELIDALTVGAVPLSSATPADVSSAGSAGVATSASRADHVHDRGADLDAAVAASHPAASVGATDNGLSVVGATQVFSMAAAAAGQSGAVNLAIQKLGALAKWVDQFGIGAAPAGTVLLDAYAGAVRRLLLTTQGILTAIVQDALNIEQGQVSLSSPNSHPGISMGTENAGTFDRSDIRHRDGGGFDFAGQAGLTIADIPPIIFSMLPAGASVPGTFNTVGTFTAEAAAVFNRSSANNAVAFLKNAVNTGLSALNIQDESAVVKGIFGHGGSASSPAALRSMLTVNATAGVDLVWAVANAIKATFDGTAFTLNIATANGLLVGGVVVPTISSSSVLTSKTISGGTVSGTIAGTATFSGGVTLTAPTINACTTSGTWSGNSTFSGNLTLSGANTYSGLSTRSSGIVVKTRATNATTVTHATTDEVILASGASGACTVNLVTAIGNTGLRLTVVKSDSGANAVTLDGSGAQTINGAATLALAAQFDRATIVSDGANWVRVA